MPALIRALCAALAVISGTASAQDSTSLTDQYRTAQGVYLPGGFAPLDQRLAMAGLLGGLAGRWLPASVIAQGGPDLAAEDIATVCDGAGAFVLAVPTPYQFTMTRQRRDTALTEHYDLVSGTLFQKRVDDAAFLAFMGLDDTQVDMAVQMLASANRFGPVLVLHPSPDVLVLQPALGRAAEIYLRCP